MLIFEVSSPFPRGQGFSKASPGEALSLERGYQQGFVVNEKGKEGWGLEGGEAPYTGDPGESPGGGGGCGLAFWSADTRG